MLWKAKRALERQEIRDETDFELARESDEVLDELLSGVVPTIDIADEFDMFTRPAILCDMNDTQARAEASNLTRWKSVFQELIIDGQTINDVIKHLIKTDDNYAKRFKDELIQEYRQFNF